MGKLRVMSFCGDRTVVWDRERAEVGDLEALEAVREAERILEDGLRRGATAFRVDPDLSVTRVAALDTDADLIVMVPRVVGG